MSTYQEQFKFILDLRDCKGKTIEDVEFVSMEFGCTFEQAYAVKFNDGTRCFILASTGKGIMNPDIKAVEQSNIFTTDEYLKMERDRINKIKYEQKERENRKRRQLEELKKELGE